MVVYVYCLLVCYVHSHMSMILSVYVSEKILYFVYWVSCVSSIRFLALVLSFLTFVVLILGFIPLFCRLQDAKVMSWWDYGYQITAMANRTILVDNNTWNNTHISRVGQVWILQCAYGVRVTTRLTANGS